MPNICMKKLPVAWSVVCISYCAWGPTPTRSRSATSRLARAAGASRVLDTNRLPLVGIVPRTYTSVNRLCFTGHLSRRRDVIQLDPACTAEGQNGTLARLVE